MSWQSINRNKRVKIVIFLKNNGGIGDNIRALIDMFCLALNSGHIILLDINYPYPLAHVLSERARKNFVFSKFDDWDTESNRTPVNNNKQLFSLMNNDVNTVYAIKGPHMAPWIKQKELKLNEK